MTLEEFEFNYSKGVDKVEKNLSILKQVIDYDKEIGIGNYSYCDDLVLIKPLCEELFQYYENIYGINYINISTNRLNIAKIYPELAQINEKKDLPGEYETTIYSLTAIDQRYLKQFYDILHKHGYSYMNYDWRTDVNTKIVYKNYSDLIKLQKIITDFILVLKNNWNSSYFGDVLQQSLKYNCAKLDSYLEVNEQKVMTMLSSAGIDKLNFRIESISEFNQFLDFLISLKRSELVIKAFNNDYQNQEDVIKRILTQNKK